MKIKNKWRLILIKLGILVLVGVIIFLVIKFGLQQSVINSVSKPASHFGSGGGLG